MTLNWAVSGAGAGQHLLRSALPLLWVFTPPMCPIIAERLQLPDRRFLLWLDFVLLDVQSLLTCDDLAKFSPSLQNSCPLLRKKRQVSGPYTLTATPPSLESSMA